jgi:hypothetical protein
MDDGSCLTIKTLLDIDRWQVILHQIYRLKFKLTVKLPLFHLEPFIPSQHLDTLYVEPAEI